MKSYNQILKYKSECLTGMDIKAYRGKILMEAKDALSAIIGEEPAKLAIKAIHAGAIPHTSIAF